MGQPPLDEYVLREWETSARNGWSPPSGFVLQLIAELRQLRGENKDLRAEINEHENRLDPDPVVFRDVP